MTAPAAIIDIGSNSVRLAVYETGYGAPVTLFNEKVLCHLGRDLGRTGALSPLARERALLALEGFKLIARALDVPVDAGGITAVATAAVRDASDGRDFLEEATRRTGIAVRVLNGDEEARIAARGVLATIPAADGIAADLGGGSLELARIAQGQVHETVSLKLGTLRLAAFSRAEMQEVAETLGALPESLRRTKALYIIGGSWRSLMRAHRRENDMDGEDVHGYSLPYEDVLEFARRIETLPADELVRRFSMEPKRAQTMGIAAWMLGQLVRAMRPDAVTVSSAGLRDGLLWEMMHP